MKTYSEKPVSDPCDIQAMNKVLIVLENIQTNMFLNGNGMHSKSTKPGTVYVCSLFLY